MSTVTVSYGLLSHIDICLEYFVEGYVTCELQMMSSVLCVLLFHCKSFDLLILTLYTVVKADAYDTQDCLHDIKFSN